MQKIVGIIPARGGSKGIPRKNIRDIAGFPLIYWSIEAAKSSKLLHECYVSTEDDEIADIARGYGSNVLIRPEELSRDDTTTLAVLQHIVKEVNADAVMVLQPTSPVRDKTTIDDCISDYNGGDYDTLATGFHAKMIEYGTHKNMRRQDIQGFFHDDGNVYIIDSAIINRGDWSGDKICRKVLPRECHYEIDDDIDFFICESLLKKRISEGVQPWNIMEQLSQIKMLIMDVDGVLTDAGMYYSETGDEMKKFNTRDGKGIELLRNLGIKTAIITSEDTDIVASRAKKLSIDHLVQGAKKKGKAFKEIADSENIPLQSIAYIGDDINDLEPFELAGFPVSVADAADELRSKSLYQTRAFGGHGAVRELCDLLCRARST